MNRSVSRSTSFRPRPPCARLDPPGLVSPAGLPPTALAGLVAAFLIHGSVPAGAVAAQTVDRYELEVLENLPLLVPESEPVFRIGGAGAPEEELIGRVGTARLTAEGGVVLLDRTEPFVRVFGPDGQLRGVLGRAGDGPGEFSGRLGMDVFPLVDGGVVVWDGPRRAAMRFGPDGELQDHFTLFPPLEWEEGGLGGPRLLGLLDDGSYLFASVFQPPRPSSGAHVHLSETVLHRVDPDTGDRTFWRRLQVDGSVRHAVVSDGGGRSSGVSGHSLLGQGLVAAAGNHLLWTPPGRVALEWWSPEGGAARRAELAIPLRPMEDEVRDDVARSIAGRGPADARTIRPELLAPTRALLEEIEHLPAASGIALHSGGEIWVRTLHLEEGQRHPTGTLVLSDQGRPVAWFLPPLDEDERPVGRVLDARDGRVLLLRRGELGVEEIQVHRLELRPPDAAR